MKSTLTIDDRLLRIRNLNLFNVCRKLKEPYPEGHGWNDAQVLEAEKWYRRFLSIKVMFPDEVHVPNGPIDIFWHQHILDTRAYAKDCDDVFGFFLHHNPYFGMNGDADKRDSTFVETDARYQEVFEESCRHMPAFKQDEPETTKTKKPVTCMSCASCGTQTNPQPNAQFAVGCGQMCASRCRNE